jgi:hypothetical protein
MGKQMEPEVHIIEKYFQEVLHCFTMTNIQLEEQREIDLLAINTLKSEKSEWRPECYHVESSIRTTSKLRLNATSKDDKHNVEYFYREKFGNWLVREYVNWVFNNQPYRKIIIAWDTQGDFEKFSKKVKDGCDIEVWLMKGIVYQLSTHKTTSGSRDDILRTMELVLLEKEWEKETLMKSQKS